MAERLCKVTVTDSAGCHSLDIVAPSVMRAACYFWAQIRSNPSLHRIQFADDTLYQIQPEGSEKIFSVTHREMLTWAQREAERANRSKTRT